MGSGRTEWETNDLISSARMNQKNIRVGSNRNWKHILDKIKSGSKGYQLLCANCNLEKELKRRGYQPLDG